MQKSFHRKKPRFLVHFNDGPFIEYLEGDLPVVTKFYDGTETVFSTRLEPAHWSKCFRRYCADWVIEALGPSDRWLYRHVFDPSYRRVRINLDSKSLGDTLAWIPQVNRFAGRWPDAEVFCASFLPELGFDRTYTGVKFIEPDSVLEDVYATYDIGYYFGESANHHPNDPRTVPLGKVASDILGIEYQEVRPKIHVENPERTIAGRYVCIATQSTAGCKLWQYEGGWQKVIDQLRAGGYQVVLIQQEEGDFRGVVNKSGDNPLQERVSDLLHCEFFIGLGSGLSWLAWALGRPVVLISGFSEPYSEFESDCYRVINPDVCHGCWNSAEYAFDRGDWDWCPRHKGTGRRFECSHEITPHMVLAQVDRIFRGN